MTKIVGSGSASGSGAISQRHGSADQDPDLDPHQNVMDPQHKKCEEDNAIFAVVGTGSISRSPLS
jgi:hypothetical protein